jgi:branched-chain amino acid transport system ATP-binding protein
MPNVLRAEGITVKFGGVTAVNKVSLSLGSGEILGLIGPNGAGKTTLFNAVTGFAPMHSGRITLLDRDITALPAFKRTRLGFGRTFQNVLVAAFLTAKRRSEAERLAMSVLEQVGLADRAHQPALDLNLARRRRLELAKALAVKPKVLFLDEIMAGLNPPALREMIAFVRSLSAQGLAVLMVEHIMEAIIELSDHVIVLASGEKIAEGTPQQVTSNERVIEAYLGTD